MATRGEYVIQKFSGAMAVSMLSRDPFASGANDAQSFSIINQIIHFSKNRRRSRDVNLDQRRFNSQFESIINGPNG